MSSLLPPNASPQERAIEGATDWEVETPIRELWDPDTCPESLLPWLAWGLSVDDWSPDWPEVVKRSVVRSAIENHVIKGTRKSVVDAVEAYGSNIVIREWFEETPPRPPYTFRAVLTLSRPGDASLTEQLQEAVITAINRNKPVRAHYDVILGINAGRRIPVYGFARPCLYKRIKVNAQ